MPAADFPVHPDQIPRLGSGVGVRLREDTIYTDHEGKEKKGIRKRTEKVLAKLQEPLRKVLEPHEAILYVSGPHWRASAFEQLVFTNRRLLFFLVKRDGSWTRSLRSVRWGDLAEAKVKWLGPTLRLKYLNGKKEPYEGLRQDDAKKIKVLLAVLLPASAGEATPAQAVASHCPDCLAALTPEVYQCSQCGLAISVPGSAWSPKAISFISFFFTFLPAGIMHAINYERLGYPEKKKLRLILVIVGFIVFTAAIFLTPDNRSTRQIFAAINLGISAFFYQDQKAIFQQHLSRGGKKAPIRVPLALSFLWVVIFLGGLVGWAYLEVARDEEKFNQAVELLNSGEYETAGPIFKEYKEKYPEELAAYWNLAVIYLNTDRPEFANREIEQLLQKNPNNEEAKEFLTQINALLTVENLLASPPPDSEK
ncbi:MAG: tetratricopeptide repeat protein [Terriglobia bacterium]